MSTTISKTTISDDNYSFLQRYVYDQSGIVLDTGKQYLLEARLSPILRERKVTDINSLCALLRAATDLSLRKTVLEAMTTNETFFFRDASPFEALKKHIIPELIQSKSGSQTINVWSAAASTGQEIYSIAMLLLEAGLQNWNLGLFASDYSEQVLEKARAGRYLQIDVNRGLPAAYLVKYFNRVGVDWEVKAELRKRVHFEQLDLRNPTGKRVPFDIIFCRNVLIYFDVKTKQAVLNQIARTTSDGAYLALGAAETLLGITCPFERVLVGQSVFYKKR